LRLEYNHRNKGVLANIRDPGRCTSTQGELALGLGGRADTQHATYSLYQLLTAVRFNHSSPQGSIYEGRAISISMEFNTTFSWLGQEDLGLGVDVEKGKAELTWDIAVSQDDWVVLGRKKGQYTAQVSYV